MAAIFLEGKITSNPTKTIELCKRQIIIVFTTSKTVGFIHLSTLAHSMYLRTFCVDTYITLYLRWKAAWKSRKYPSHPNLCTVLSAHMINTCIDLEVTWSREVTYFSILKFLITLGSASAVTSSSPMPVHLDLSQSRLVQWRISTNQQ